MESINLAIEAEPLVTETVDTLVSDLDPTLYYHCPAHTILSWRLVVYFISDCDFQARFV